MMEPYRHSTLRFNVLVLHYVSTGTTLPFLPENLAVPPSTNLEKFLAALMTLTLQTDAV
jgi:hypothetical protein